MKTGGIILLIMAGTAFGFYRAYGFRKRISDIIQLQNAFRMLETEIFYTLTPIPSALKTLEERLPHPMQKFFQKVQQAIDREQCSVFQAWEEGIELLRQNSFCSAQELGALRSFGMSLGQGDIYAQQKNFQLLQQRLQYALDEAEQQRREQGRVWQYMGVCVSVAVAILLC